MNKQNNKYPSWEECAEIVKKQQRYFFDNPSPCCYGREWRGFKNEECKIFAQFLQDNECPMVPGSDLMVNSALDFSHVYENCKINQEHLKKVKIAKVKIALDYND